jgi:hypothetical protein
LVQAIAGGFARHCAIIVIFDFRRVGLSADDRRIAVQQSAFWVFSGGFGQFPAVRDGFQAFRRLPV